ncbi:hypothetical protein BGW38_004964 [Lunasporangiospora selenospora]|uniref:Uncharacterized protein n=1 Tax=Lunasporangiospora selenospora TaxID=979761 RepID=A0A9P6KB70_9FUNG|nr:hypothetical protein BGW38_004964 [Lunasporangiospora selenospora]
MSKSTFMVALLALVFCLASTVSAAERYNPGSPFNCTVFKANCGKLTGETFGKNSSYSGPSAQCNVTNLEAAKPLCGLNVLCMATFTGRNPNVSTPLPTPSGNSTNGNSTNGTNTPTIGNPNMYSFSTEDLTEQLIGMYDTGKCPKNAAIAQAATSLTALVVMASLVSMMANML